MPYNNGKSFQDRFYVQYSELVGLDGSYLPYNDKYMGVVLNIHPQKDGKIVVSANRNTVTLSEGDQFRIDSTLELVHVCGPDRYKDPYRAAIAETVLGQNILEFEESSYSWESIYPNWAFAYRYSGGKHETHNFMDEGLGKKVDESWDFYAILDDRHHVHKIRIRPHAHETGAEHLKKFLFKMQLDRKPSGMFDYYHDLIRQHRDAEYEKWWEEIMSENRKKENLAFDAAMEVISRTGTSRIELEGKVFLTKDGAVYKNAISTKNLVSTDKLRKNGLFLKIAEAARSLQPNV